MFQISVVSKKIVIVLGAATFWCLKTKLSLKKIFILDMSATSWCHYEEIEQYFVWKGTVWPLRSHPIKAVTGHAVGKFFDQLGICMIATNLKCTIFTTYTKRVTQLRNNRGAWLHQPEKNALG